jgi:type IV pilus assembly protein PilA
MLASIRKARDENEEGFTLIELLVVMIIIGILAAIAIPVFLSQRNKAKDTSVKADVTVIGKDMAAYYVDGTKDLTVVTAGTSFNILETGNVTPVDTGNLSAGNTIAVLNSVGKVATGNWCAAVTNSGSGTTWNYSSVTGLTKGACAVVV